jgi:PBP4 family serine-type D-alanyl-D-alanine carboxypeptidase
MLKKQNLQVLCSCVLLLLVNLVPLSNAVGQSQTALPDKVREIMDRPEFAKANFGIEFCSTETGKAVYGLNEHKLFVPASTTKLVTEGTLLASLGAEHRFHTRVYRTGPIDKKGTLRGDLVLVAAGDPSLSNRVQPDGTLAFENLDHSYGGPALKADPLIVVRQLAKKVLEKGIRKVDGRVLVDSSLFGDIQWERDIGVVISSIVINDNIIDLLLKPGKTTGDPAGLQSSPQTSYVKLVNKVVTGSDGSSRRFERPEIKTNLNGSITVSLVGSVPRGAAPVSLPFFVPSPTRFAETVFREALISVGVGVRGNGEDSAPDFRAYEPFYVPANQIAEHVSPALAEEVKVTLKVSQNIHAFMGPYLLGTLVAKNRKDPLRAGFEIERAFLQKGKLDLSEASQGDGAGGDPADLFSPDFMCRYLAYWASRPDYEVFFKALPIMGKDGTLATIQVSSPVAGHAFAKTGTYGADDNLNGILMLTSKGLAGYLTTADGHQLSFAIYVNHVHTSQDPEVAQQTVGQAIGEIVAAAHEMTLDGGAAGSH